MIQRMLLPVCAGFFGISVLFCLLAIRFSNSQATYAATAAQLSGSQDVSTTPMFLEPRISVAGFTDSDYQRHIKELKKKLPHNGFQVVIEKPFVVVGDEDLETVKIRATRTVKWAVDLLKKDYFTKDPAAIIDIWLFKDEASYKKHNVELFGSEPSTPFGFYSSTEKALVMNISTGGGTLVHEIVHPFIESNFPDCPSWFNEGLASLYEQSTSRHGKIWGKTNWRLRGLQGTIAAKRLRTFEDLCSTTSRQFYNDDRGSNYSQARYLCYYLQDKGLLVDFYTKFRDNVNSDPTGYDTLVEILGKPDMNQFNKDWQAYVMKLKF